MIRSTSPASSIPPSAAPPVQLTGFVGREVALETVRRLLEGTRLLTLTGAGGSGKTRLALEALRQAAGAGNGDVAWIELASLGNPVALAHHIALALGVRVDGSGSPEQALIALLRDRNLLLVLDNCEHLIESCARIVGLLLQACPGLQVLATSREALGISGERCWLVPPLSLPPESVSLPVEEAAAAESVRLFVERAADVQPGFALSAANAAAIVTICRRLDGLPLAIELAAARANVLAPAEIAERLADRFSLLATRARATLPRHRTLRAAMDWSYELLTGKERLMLERLAVFAGGFTLDAAEAVCAGGEIGAAEVLDLLASLTIRSLVSMQEEEGSARYRLLETVREYAQARRNERAGEADVRVQHAGYFLALARRLEPELILGRAAALHQADVEHDNFRTALAWSAAQRAGASHGLPLAWALMWYWFHRQLWRVGFGFFETALETAVEPAADCRAAALHALGIFGLYIGDARSGGRLIEAEKIWQAMGNRRWHTFTLLCRATEASLRREPAQARALADRAVALASELDDSWIVALTTVHALVPALVWEQNWREAEARLEESERAYREHDYRIGIAYVLDTRAYVALQLGNASQAAALASASLRADPQFENRWLAARSLRTLAAVAFAHGDSDRAVRLFAAAAAMYEAIGANPLSGERRAVNELGERLEAEIPANRLAAERHAGRSLSFAAAVEMGLDSAVPVAAASAAGGLAAGSGGPTLAAAVDAGASAASASAAQARAKAQDKDTGRLTIKALGALEVLQKGAPLPREALPSGRPRELLLYLLAHPEGQTREQIGLELWADASAAQLKNNFHVTLHNLRKTGGFEDIVRFEHGVYRIDMAGKVDFDAARFESQANTALRLLRSDDNDAAGSEAAAGRLTDALALYRGPFLASENFGGWQLEIRERLERLYAACLDALAGCHEASGDHSDAIELLQRLVGVDSLHEDGVRRLMRSLTREGRRGEALRAFEQFSAELARELGVAPERKSAQLAARIRGGEAV